MKQIESDGLIEPKGYTIDELRYRRAFALAKYEMAKYQTMEEVRRVSSGFSSPRGWLGRIMGAFNYVDYGILAFQIGKKIFKWRRKR